MPKFTILLMPFVLVGMLETYAATQIQYPGASPVNVLSGGTLAPGENLDRDAAFEARVSRAIRLAHATRAEGFENLVWTEPSSRCEQHRRDYDAGGERPGAVARAKHRSRR